MSSIVDTLLSDSSRRPFLGETVTMEMLTFDGSIVTNAADGEADVVAISSEDSCSLSLLLPLIIL